MSRHLPTDDRLAELLAMRAAEGIGPDAERELGEWADCDLLDEAAALLSVGLIATDLEEMPPSVRAGLERIARTASDPSAPEITTPDMALGGTAPPRGPGWLTPTGWLAAAACLVLAVMAWTAGRTPAPASPAERLAAMESRPGILRTPWLGLDDAALADAPHRFDTGLSGEVLWDPATSEGFLVFEGLAVNDPSEYQYQLWIFDADRPTGDLPQYGDGILSQRPVDGGVFDAAGTGRLVIPIDAKLPIGRAALFAVTVEPPGGVVVSRRDIVTLATAP